MLKSAVMLSEAKHLHLAVALALLIGCKGQVREQPAAAPRASQSASQSDIFSGMIGKSVRISFRRDALGLAATSVPEPTAATITGRTVQLAGIVQSASEE